MEELKEQIRIFWNLPISLKAFYCLLFLTFGNIIFYYLQPIINSLGLSGSTDNIHIFLWIIVIYFSLPLISKSIRLLDISLYVAVAAFFYFSPVIYPETKHFVNDKFAIFAFQTIPLYFLGLAIDFRRDKSILVFISKAQLLMTLLFVLLSLFRLINTKMEGELMWFAYSILLPVMFMYYTYSKSKSKSDLFYFILGVMMILMFGNRGSLLCLIIYLLVFLFLNYKDNILLTLYFILSLGGIYIFIRPIMIVLMHLTKMVGLTTRIFDFFMKDALFDYDNSTGRNKIHELLWKHISNDREGIGYGFGSDRMMGRNGTEYAHNLIFEVWMDFGIYIGSILLLLFAFFIIMTLKKVYGREQFHFFLILLIWSVGHSMLSGSYLHDFQIYFFIGFCVNILRSQDGQEFGDEEDKIIISIPNNYQ